MEGIPCQARGNREQTGGLSLRCLQGRLRCCQHNSCRSAQTPLRMRSWFPAPSTQGRLFGECAKGGAPAAFQCQQNRGLGHPARLGQDASILQHLLRR
jgi:hypothetical protein